MKKSKLAFGLAIVAGLICLGNFIHSWIRFGKHKYMILLAGIFIIAFGISTHYSKKN